MISKIKISNIGICTYLVVVALAFMLSPTHYKVLNEASINSVGWLPMIGRLAEISEFPSKIIISTAVGMYLSPILFIAAVLRINYKKWQSMSISMRWKIFGLISMFVVMQSLFLSYGKINNTTYSTFGVYMRCITMYEDCAIIVWPINILAFLYIYIAFIITVFVAVFGKLMNRTFKND